MCREGVSGLKYIITSLGISKFTEVLFKFSSRNCIMKLRGSLSTRLFRFSLKRDLSNAGVGKISAVRKKITRNSVEILEAKPAASVLKKLNWENHHIFGGVVKAGKSERKKSDFTSEINNYKVPFIQYNPCLLIPETNNTSQTSDCLASDVNACSGSDSVHDSKIISLPKKTNSENILDTILKFPLLNSSTDENNLKNKVGLLRQHLQTIRATAPSVTKILDQTMPADRAAALARWKMEMIKQMGKENFETYQKEMLSSGSSFHGTVNDFLSGVPENELTVQASNVGHWKSIQNVLPNIQTVKLLEENVTHPFLHYRGVVDCIAQYRDQLVVVEWKTSKKAKSSLRSTFDSPLQLAAYVGALNFDPRFQYMVDKGLIVIVYEGGDPAHSHFLQKEVLNEYWTEWLRRLTKYWESV